MVSVTIICRNEEDNIGDCLESVKWADEIIVVDSFSKDRTVEIARRYTDKVIEKEWEGFAKQRAYALSLASGEWVFPIDADERCTPELMGEIQNLLKTSHNRNGFRIPRRSYFLGKPVRHSGWYPDYQMRFFLKDRAKVTPRDVHEGYEVEGKTGMIKSSLLHYTVSSIQDYTRKINHYSSLQALDKAKKKKIGFYDLFFRPISSFLRQFIVKSGYRDGITGLMITFFDVFTNALTYMKAWEIQNREKD